MAGRRALVWLRKGLRLHDNPGLCAACDGASSVFAVFVLDRWTSRASNVGHVRFRFLVEALCDLDASLRARGCAGGVLVLRGEPEQVLPVAWRALDVSAVALDESEEQEPHDRARDARVRALAQGAGLEVLSRAGHWLHSPARYRELLGSGAVPTSMRGFQQLFARAGAVPEPLAAPAAVPWLDSEAGPRVAALRAQLAVGAPPRSETEWAALYASLPGRAPPGKLPLRFPGGETAALARLDAAIRQRPQWVCSFDKPKTAPSSLVPDTAAISPYLSHGCLSVRECYHAILRCYRAGKGQHTRPPVSLEGQLLWREHWYAIAALCGYDVSRMRGNALCRQIPWDDSPAAEERLRAWAEARTGFPFIDALMKQLRTEGWISHLGRHAVACFLTRGDLWVHWERGQKVFDELLIDADWSINACNWQWLSCSAFFYQYFRCYSPVSFGQKSDPEGAFIRKWLPELRKMDRKHIYAPWLAPRHVQEAAGCVIGKDYPAPIVQDHTATSKANMTRMAQAYAAHKALHGGGGGGGGGGGDDEEEEAAEEEAKVGAKRAVAAAPSSAGGKGPMAAWLNSKKAKQEPGEPR
jgi:cryptochrome